MPPESPVGGGLPAPPDAIPVPEVLAPDLLGRVETRTLSGFERPLTVTVREARLLDQPPWVRSLGKLSFDVQTEGWKFPAPPAGADVRPMKPAEPPREPGAGPPAGEPPRADETQPDTPGASLKKKHTRLKPPADSVMLKERLLYLLQPPLENIFAGCQIRLPFKPFPYQTEGIAFLMPRHAAMLADEMGLGKTMQTIVALRLLFHAGLIRSALLICPKPLMNNWARELRLWADDVPFETVSGPTETRKTCWKVSNCPLKLVNYEVLTRDAAVVADPAVRFDVVVLDEAQRIKNRDSKTAQVVRSIHRERSWALTGTPIENRPEDLVNLFAFVDPERVPADTPAKKLPQLTGGMILRRVKEDVMTDMPPKTVQDVFLDLTPAQRESYELAQKDGVVRLNALGETLTVQHVFELVMRLKQICNFDPLTGQSAKLEQLVADLTEVAESGRKAIVFSQWVEPLELMAKALAPIGPLQFHGRIPAPERQAILDRFKTDPTKHVILMSYATGSVGLNLQFTNYVFLFDRWWNPAIEDQAINRAHRIGQKEPVLVKRFIAQETIEGKIADVLEQKRQLFNELIGRNETPPALGLTQDEIFGLFEIKPHPKRAA